MTEFTAAKNADLRFTGAHIGKHEKLNLGFKFYQAASQGDDKRVNQMLDDWDAPTLRQSLRVFARTVEKHQPKDKAVINAARQIASEIETAY